VFSQCEVQFQTVCGDGEQQDPNSAGFTEQCDLGADNNDA